MFELMTKGLTLKFLATVLVRRRGDNDSFGTQGVVRRYALAIQGYQKLGSHFWGAHSEHAFHIRRVLRNEFRLRAFLAAKALCATTSHNNDKKLLDELIVQTYSDPSLSSSLKLLAYNLVPVKSYLRARTFYWRFRQKSSRR
jgi:abequosyltransferase